MIYNYNVKERGNKIMKHIYLLWNDYEQMFVEMTDKDFNKYINSDDFQYINTDGFYVRRLGIIKSIIFKIEMGISIIIDMLMGNIE